MLRVGLARGLRFFGQLLEGFGGSLEFPMGLLGGGGGVLAWVSSGPVGSLGAVPWRRGGIGLVGFSLWQGPRADFGRLAGGRGGQRRCRGA